VFCICSYFVISYSSFFWMSVFRVCVCWVLLPCFSHYFGPYRYILIVSVTLSNAACFSCCCVAVAASIVAILRSALSTSWRYSLTLVSRSFSCMLLYQLVRVVLVFLYSIFIAAVCIVLCGIVVFLYCRRNCGCIYFATVNSGGILKCKLVLF
jgi:hypothetical protein